MIIGFAGKAGSGKTTIADIFVQNHGFTKVAYADPLKEALAVLTGLPISNFKDSFLKEQTLNEFNITPRKMMQLCGTEFVREMIHPDFWIIRMNNTLKEFRKNKRPVVIDDVRFENEAALIRNMGGVVIHLERDCESRTGEVSHSSEAPLTEMVRDIRILSGDRGPSYTYGWALTSLSTEGVRFSYPEEETVCL